MGIISKIGRRSLTVRLLIWSVYFGLTVGAVTMLYPFALMVAGSTKSSVDTPDARIIPRYLVNREALYQKYVSSLFNESLQNMQVSYGLAQSSFRTLEEPADYNPELVEAWVRFCEESSLPFYTHTLGHLAAPVSKGVSPYHLRQFKQRMLDQFDGDISRLNDALGTNFINWNAFIVHPEVFLLRRNKPSGQPLYEVFRRYKSKQPLSSRFYNSPEGFYRIVYLQTKYPKDLKLFNEARGTRHSSWNDVHLDRKVPDGPDRTPVEREDWLTFVRFLLNLYWVRVAPEATPRYREYLQAKYMTIQGLNKHYATEYASFSDIPMITSSPSRGLVQSDWSEFIAGWKDPQSEKLHRVPAEDLYIHSVDFMFRDYLRKTYGTIAKLNESMDLNADSWLDILPPQQEFHHREFSGRTGSLRREFTFRNYITVVDFIILHGRGVVNTVVYCALAILSALIINPLAAYALSRYRPPSQYKILLFLMMTMAFPPMVTQIPVFLMLREFRLLNTFWALILPGLANGYSIFLLKGFFDSLPRELYESASMDGAGEFRIFWQITMSLSKPILAVIALSAFTQAYSNFMMALLICQDEKMWTLMPWLYQLQQRSGEGVVFASLLIASVPTLLVFAFCQNIIMRGIVVPVEK